jgi:hypothetical protein
MALAAVHQQQQQQQQQRNNGRLLRHARINDSSNDCTTNRLDKNQALSFSSSFSSRSSSSSTSSRKSSLQDHQEQEQQSNMKSYKLQGWTTKDDDDVKDDAPPLATTAVREDQSVNNKMSRMNKNSSSSSSSSKTRRRSRRRSGGCGVTVKTNTGHVLQTDLPRTMGGRDSAPQPVEMLLASWMGCTQATALFVGRHLLNNNAVIDCSEFDNITAFRDERGALALPIDRAPSVVSRLQRVTGTITVHTRCQQDSSCSNNNNNNATGISAEQLLVLKEQTELRCPVANMMIASGCVMDVTWVVGAANSGTTKDDT